MIKNLFYLAVIAIFISCQHEDFEVPQKEVEVGGKKTKSAVSASYANVDQLVGLPIYIKLSDQGREDRFLTKKKVSSGKAPYLSSKDDGSGNQKWIIRKSSKISYDGKPLYAIQSITSDKVLSKETDKSSSGQLIVTEPVGNNVYNVTDLRDLWVVEYNEATDNFYFSHAMYRNKYMSRPSSAKNDNPLAIIEKATSNSDYQRWEIAVVEEFDILSIRFEVGVGDNVAVQPLRMRTKGLKNDTPDTVERSITIEEVLTSQSELSEAKGTSITIKNSAEFSYKVPLFAEGKINVETTSNQTFSYSTKNVESSTFKITETITQKIPPFTTYDVHIVWSEYTVDLTYVAKLKGKTTGKIIESRGVWKGKIISDDRIEIYDPNSKLVKSMKIN